MSSETLCTLGGISKRFSAVEALSNVHLDICEGEIHALAGENGAGKSTLVKIITGILRPDSGWISFGGTTVELENPLSARSLGITAAHQELELFGQMSVAENCFVQSSYPRRTGMINWRGLRRRARSILDCFDASIPLNRQVRFLSPSQRQLVEIAGALVDTPRLLVLDEPTAALSRTETRSLFNVLKQLTERGTAVLYISHRLSEIFTIADRVTVLCDGRNVWTKPVYATDSDDVIQAMIGRDMKEYAAKPPEPGRKVFLDVDGLSDGAGGAFQDISLQVRSGEIVGLYGLVGAGRSEFAEALFGLRKAKGAVRCRGGEGPFQSPRAACSAGIAYLPEDRRASGSFPGLTVRENITIASLSAFCSFSFVKTAKENASAYSLAEELDIRPRNPDVFFETLSGGNQQKVLLARWLVRTPEPDVWILDEPTRGIDVGARAQMHRLICSLAARGRAVLLISSDLPEVYSLSRRVVVFREGAVAAFLDTEEAGEEETGRAALPDQMRTGVPDGASRARRTFRPVHLLAQREASVFAAVIIIAAFMSIHTPGFLGWENLCSMAANTASLAVAAVGMTFVISSGAIDISAGSVLALSAAGCALAANAGAWMPLALCAAAGIGLSAGLLNAAVCSAGRLHPIITTLGTMGIFRGIFLLWTGGSWIKMPKMLLRCATDGPFGVPWTVLGMVMLSVVCFWFSCFKPLARRILMLGDNANAAALYGISRHRIRTAAFALCGTLTGISAVFHTARYGQVQSNTGIGFELQVIAAALIGGANIHGGRGTVPGAVAGAFLIGVLAEARSVLGIHERWQLIGVGTLMLLAVGMESVLKRFVGGRS